MTTYTSGDVANGHILGTDGQWHAITTTLQPTQSLGSGFSMSPATYWTADGCPHPIAGTTWSITDHTRVTRTFNWGRFILSLVAFLLLVWFVIGFLFLFFGFSWTEHVTGYVAITVRQPDGTVLVSHIAPSTTAEIATIVAQVNQANQYAAGISA